MMDYLRYYLGPAAVLIGIVGFVLGGNWLWLGFSTYAVFAAADILLPRDTAQRQISRPFWADLPLYIHAFLLPTLYVALAGRAMADGGAGNWSGLQIAGAILTLAWLSVVPNLPIQHELMHRRDVFSRKLAFILGSLYGDPLRDIAHTTNHHLNLGTPADGDTARRGETMYTFPLRATLGAYRDSIASETSRLERLGKGFWNSGNRCLHALAFVAAVLTGIAWAAGIGAASIALMGIAIAKLVVEAFNYYQHYGLVRVPGTPYDRRHLWNHLSPVTRAVAVEITNHSDHHMDSYKPFYRLRPDLQGPQMPSIFLCFMLGLFPPLWYRYVAMPRLKAWDQHYATPDERALAREANARAGWPDWFDEIQADDGRLASSG
ncbi:MAG: xylene monooxygenase [Salinisphaeraceae bacterium]|nr:xylene monooxygenase [Salinisphaeraceae bacterium]